jgi:hypothetical protein
MVPAHDGSRPSNTLVLPEVSEAMIYGAMSRLILRRLTHLAA